MPILAGDIKLMATQVMDDVPEGGGAPTAVVIPDGASNSIFPDISELDRAGGRVNLRKSVVKVATNNTDGYYGANVIVADPPDDPRVAIALFGAGSVFDRRSDAQARVESYLAAGPEWGGYLLENHIIGQRAIQLFQRPSAEIPPVGRTLLLIADEGKPSQFYQYVRVTRVSSVQRTFTYSTGSGPVDYLAAVVTCDISDALRYDFPGSPPSRLFEKDRTLNRVVTTTKDTVVADAARYYGTVPLATAASLGALGVAVDSVFAQLVPSAQTEIPLTLRTLADELAPMIASASASLTYSSGVAVSIAPGGQLVLRTGAKPGSVSVVVGSVTVTDDGAGGLVRSGAAIGTITYATGEMLFDDAAPTATGVASITYQPATAAAQQAHTLPRAVTQENRSLNWTGNLTPLPAPGVLSLAYMTGGNWYVLRDDGAGALRGSDAAHGAGTISYVTGGYSVTLGALPDVGSQLLFTWASPAHYSLLVPDPVAPAEIVIASPRITAPITPGTVTLAWTVGGVAKTATDTGGAGAISGDATGSVLYGTPEIRFRPSPMPDAGTNVTVTYTKRPRDTGTTATLSYDAGEALDPYNVELHILCSLPDGTVGGGWLRDDGTGNLKLNIFDANPQHVGGGPFFTGGTVSLGTVNYATGVITVGGTFGVSSPVWNYATGAWGYAASGTATVTELDYVSFSKAAGASPGGENATVPIGETPADMPTIRINPTIPRSLVPGSLSFSYGGKIYVDRAGALYTDIDAATGSGIAAGSVNYETREATITFYATGATGTPVLLSALGRYGNWSAIDGAFRAAASPLRPESLSIVATTTDGEQITGVSEADGDVVGTWMRGSVNYDFGTAALEFGQMSGSPAVWTQRAVDPSTIRYSAVAYSYLPLDANLLGLDPVRLPSDGRVPIFRPGDFAVVGHTAVTAPATVSNGQTIDVGRVRLSRVRVLGNDGLVIAPGYTQDLDAGTVTFTDVTGYSQPVVVEHRIEDMAQVSDVDIGGNLTFTRALTHAYPLGSYVSSALVAGDMHARVSVLFDQATWNSVWADAVSGNAATGTYNDVQFPIAVTNEGAVTERWAIRFTNTTTFEVIGEHVGVIATGNTTADLAPLNPATGTPYFTLAAAGWGLGWSAGNVLRINTVGALFPVWVVRTIQQGPETVANDSFTLLIRGDVDRP